VPGVARSAVSDDDCSDLELIDRIADAVARLPLKCRGERWTSLSTCVLDAVWSLGSRYDAVVVPIVRSALSDLEPAAFLTRGTVERDPYPLTRLRDRFPDESALVASTNAQRTSSRGGITKAAAVLEHADMLLSHGVNDLLDVQALMRDCPRLEAVNADLRSVPGEGQHGIRRAYLWMLCGDDDNVKPDRRVMRWLHCRSGTTDPSEAARLLRCVARRLNEGFPGRWGCPVTPWMVDHAIWLDDRSNLSSDPDETAS
jgi:hypothetical protein